MAITVNLRYTGKNGAAQTILILVNKLSLLNSATHTKFFSPI